MAIPVQLTCFLWIYMKITRNHCKLASTTNTYSRRQQADHNIVLNFDYFFDWTQQYSDGWQMSGSVARYNDQYDMMIAVQL